MKKLNKQNIEEIQFLTKDLKVLYVEDDRDVRNKFSAVLDNIFNNVKVCVDGRDAIQKYTIDYNQKIFYDIIITDMYMPVVDGIELSKFILQQNKQQKILAISAYNDSDILESIINSGITNYIQKPVKIGKLLEVVHTIATDIKMEKEEKNEKIQTHNYLKNFDFNTGFKNINSLYTDLNNSDDKNIIIIEIKNFHKLQTIFTIDEANIIIQEFEQNLKIYTKNNTSIYKESSNKFIYLIDKASNLEQTINKLECELQDNRLHTVIGASKDNTNLLGTANMALNSASQKGFKHKIYTSELDLTHEYKNNERMCYIIDNAIEHNNVFPVFQPIYDKSKNIIKYEVLMRISNICNGEEKVFYPGDFLKISMQSNRFHELSFILINKAFEALQNSTKQFSLNISYDDIKNDILITEIENQIIKHKNIGNRLILEILETNDIEDYEVIKKFITRFKKYGVQIAIDDFGSGYSNLNHIINFHSDYIKIDGSLIRNIQKDSTSFTIVKSIVSFAKELGIKTIAEFVETKIIFDTLKTIEIDEFQGYYLSKPLRAIFKE